MGIAITNEGDTCRISVDDEMTIYTAAELKQTFLDQMNECQTMEVNLSAVSEMDTAGVQLLMMLKKEAKKQQKQLRMLEHSRPVIEVFELLNLVVHFGDPVIIPAEWQS